MKEHGDAVEEVVVEGRGLQNGVVQGRAQNGGGGGGGEINAVNGGAINAGVGAINAGGNVLSMLNGPAMVVQANQYVQSNNNQRQVPVQGMVVQSNAYVPPSSYGNHNNNY